MKIHKLASTMPIGVAILTLVSLCLATAAFNLAPTKADPISSEIEPEGGIAPFFMPSVKAWGPDIVRWAEGYGLDSNLVAAVMQIESCGDPQAVSRAGARGLFQVMPFHFSADEDMLDPETNANRGLAYLALALLKADGDVTLALAGYNGGHDVIGWESSGWPAETQRYVYWGSGIYADARSGAAESPRLREWLTAGGFNLCASAVV